MVAAVTVRRSGKAEMAYVGEKPWHGLGQQLIAGAPIEVWQEAAGMDWELKRTPVTYMPGSEGPREIDETHVIYRSDTCAPMGIVSKGYKLVQPKEVLEFFRDLIGSNGYTLDTAGTLFDGKRFWALARVGERAVVVGEDEIDGFLLLSTSCDGTLATTARFTTVRVVCNNTLSVALQGGKRAIAVHHNSHFIAENVKQRLGLARDTFREFMVLTRQLAKKHVKLDQAKEFVERLLVETKTVYTQDPRQSKQFQKILGLFEGSALGGTLLGAEGTAWGLVNSVTEFVDHHARASTDSHRLTSAWWGRGDALKTEALNRALALI